MRVSNSYQRAYEEGRFEQAFEILMRLTSKRFGAMKLHHFRKLCEIRGIENLESLVERAFEVNNWDELLQTETFLRKSVNVNHSY